MMLMVFMCHSLRAFCASSNSSWRGSISAFSSSTRCIACAYCLTACFSSGWCALMIWAGSYVGLLASDNSTFRFDCDTSRSSSFGAPSIP